MRMEVRPNPEDLAINVFQVGKEAHTKQVDDYLEKQIKADWMWLPCSTEIPRFVFESCQPIVECVY